MAYNPERLQLKLRLLEYLNMEYELLELTPYGEERTCILSRIKLIEDFIAQLKNIS